MAILTPKPTKPTKVVVSTGTKSAYQARKAVAEQMSGYDSSSPIWNKQIPEILDMIEAEGVTPGASKIIGHLRLRIVRNQLMRTK